MKITNNTLAELTSYLNDLRDIVQEMPLNKKVFKEGTTAGQIAYHVAQSANFYLRNYILDEQYERDRSKKFSLNYSVIDINSSIDKALDACKKIVNNNIDITSPLVKTKIIHSRNIEVLNVFEVIQHTTAHTAEHFGQISISI